MITLITNENKTLEPNAPHIESSRLFKALTSVDMWTRYFFVGSNTNVLIAKIDDDNGGWPKRQVGVFFLTTRYGPGMWQFISGRYTAPHSPTPKSLDGFEFFATREIFCTEFDDILEFATKKAWCIVSYLEQIKSELEVYGKAYESSIDDVPLYNVFSGAVEMATKNAVPFFPSEKAYATTEDGVEYLVNDGHAESSTCPITAAPRQRDITIKGMQIEIKVDSKSLGDIKKSLIRHLFGATQAGIVNSTREVVYDDIMWMADHLMDDLKRRDLSLNTDDVITILGPLELEQK